MITSLAKKSLLGKARARPDQVRRVLEKIRNEGFFDTVQQVRKKLDEPMPMGYSSAGIVLACGDGVQEFKPGDRVASNGPHAEVVAVPRNLCATVPDNVPFDHACFAVLGSIALQGVRLSNCTLGDTVLVIGLGLVGQLTVALLSAAGCRVIGTDLQSDKCELARKMGATYAEPGISGSKVAQLTNERGADSVLITASTKSNAPLDLAIESVRKKGRVVLVGVVGLEFDRRPWFFKEAEFVVSCSYGPGRYDADYEDRGHDYPFPYVRWTEQRNIQSVLQMMGDGKLDVAPLISHRFEISSAEKAYELVEQASEPYVGIVLEYPQQETAKRDQHQVELRRAPDRNLTPPPSFSTSTPEAQGGEATNESAVRLRPRRTSSDKIVSGVLGAGNFARMVLIPAIQQSEQFRLKTICSAKGLSAASTGKSANFEIATANDEDLFADPELDAIFSLTRHDQHFDHVLRAIASGKHVFVEKPLCLTIDQLEKIESALFGTAADNTAERDGYYDGAALDIPEGPSPVAETTDSPSGRVKSTIGEEPRATDSRTPVAEQSPSPNLSPKGRGMQAADTTDSHSGTSSSFSPAAQRVVGERASERGKAMAERDGSTVMVGFNRRFSPAAKIQKEFFADVADPLGITIRFNAGDIPADHWTQHDLEGGGRIIGEACHAIDLATFLCGSLPHKVFAESVAAFEPGRITDDRCMITIRHQNGSITNIAYLAGGDKRFPKERVEIIGGGRVGVIDDFKSVTLCRNGKLTTKKMKMDKGHREQIRQWAEALKRQEWLIDWSEIRSTTLASILAVRSIREGMPFLVP